MRWVTRACVLMWLSGLLACSAPDVDKTTFGALKSQNEPEPPRPICGTHLFTGERITKDD